MSALRAATLTAAVLVAQQVIAKATRDALFLSSFDVRRLPLMMIAAAAVSLVAVVAMSRAMAAFSPARVLPIALGVSAALLGLEWTLAPRAMALVAYLHVAAFGATLISAFWSLLDEAFDPSTAKRRIAWIAGGGTFGGLVGGLVAWQLAGATSLRTMLLVSAGLHLVAAFTVRPLRGTLRASRVPSEPSRKDAGLGYLVSLAMLVTVVAMSEAVMDYLLGAHASARHGRSPALLSFFALFHAITGVLTLVAQTFLTRAALSRLGVACSVGVLPATTLLASLVSLGPFGAVLLRGSTAVISRSVFRSAYELLFTPIPSERRRAWKTFIDVGFERFGSALGGGLVLFLLALAPRSMALTATLLLVGLSLVSLVLVRRLHVGYVSSLEVKLRSRVSARDEMLRTITSQELDRDELFNARISLPPASRTDRLIEVATVLRSGNRERITAFLAREQPLEPALIGHVIPLLLRDDLSELATAALRRGFDRGIGQLVDALLDPAMPLAIRRRVARALRTSTAQRALDGLVEALHDEQFEVRYEAGRSIVAIRRRVPALHLSRRSVVAAVQHEIEADRAIWETRVQSPRVRQSLDHVFTLLSFLHGDEAVRLASRALSATDRELRGTALEYLETVLPESIRAALWPYVAA